MAKLRIKKGDTVLVLSGKDKGLTGKVMQSYPETDRVLVEGVNRIKKHTRVSQTQRGAKTGGIVTQEAAIDVSNVMLVVDGHAVRVGYEINDEGRKIRVARGPNGKDKDGKAKEV